MHSIAKQLPQESSLINSDDEQYRSNLIQSLKIEEGSLSWEFMEKAIIGFSKIFPKQLSFPRTQQKSGIYGISTDDEFLYIGFSRSNVNARFNCRSSDVQRYNKTRNKNLYSYFLGFSEGSPLGEVFATCGTNSGNHHEKILIYETKPILNKQNVQYHPKLWVTEEVFYREKILESGSILGFSRYLIEALLESKTLVSLDVYQRGRYNPKEMNILLKATNSIIKLNLLNAT